MVQVSAKTFSHARHGLRLLLVDSLHSMCTEVFQAAPFATIPPWLGCGGFLTPSDGLVRPHPSGGIDWIEQHVSVQSGQFSSEGHMTSARREWRCSPRKTEAVHCRVGKCPSVLNRQGSVSNLATWSLCVLVRVVDEKSVSSTFMARICIERLTPLSRFFNQAHSPNFVRTVVWWLVAPVGRVRS